MSNIIRKCTGYFQVLIALVFVFCSSCEKFLDVDVSDSEIVSDAVFSSDVTATSAVLGIYNEMLNIQSFSSGSNRSVTTLAGLSSDELRSYSSDGEFLAFNQNSILENNFWNQSLWSSIFKIIYNANGVIEGLNKSQMVSSDIKKQLKAEAIFIRAFCNFYLVNLFGEVPLVFTTDYNKNSKVSRQNVEIVYAKIIDDLKQAQADLSDSYITVGRVRPNLFSATALLSRVYLYQENWQKAEEESSKILNDERYLLEDLDQVYKSTSMEAIWQLMPVSPSVNTQEGFFSILISSPVNASSRSNALTPALVDSFENGDARKVNWINSFTRNANTWYYPYKYKIRTRLEGEPIEEYSMVLRLGEQYLIRAEAKANQNKLSEAVADLDSIRSRAQLPLISDVNPGIGKEDLLLAIAKERKFELFSEWGHRWFDLKRWHKAGEVLSPLKNGWSDNDTLYPIPRLELDRNPNLGNQNLGY